jgi:lipopolysaccharide transport system ATP-binding protein
MRELMNTARLMVMVAHDLTSLREMCSRIIWLKHGQVVMDGAPNKVLDAYITEVTGVAPEPPAAAA